MLGRGRRAVSGAFITSLCFGRTPGLPVTGENDAYRKQALIDTDPERVNKLNVRSKQSKASQSRKKRTVVGGIINRDTSPRLSRAL